MRVSGLAIEVRSLRGLAAQWVESYGEPAAFGVGQTQSAATEVDLKETVFFLEVSHDLLPVTVEPASEHGDEDLQDHRCASGWKRRRNHAIQSTSNI
jgi:hypothetical protein